MNPVINSLRNGKFRKPKKVVYEVSGWKLVFLHPP
jgi:hypothetical protein